MTKPLRALIVEDSEDDALLIVNELKRGGYDIYYERVATAEAFSSALSRKSWDAVLADHGMSHFSARAALSLLSRSGLDLPFIIVSGTLGDENAVKAMKAGAHDYITKGSLARLVPAVEREIQEAESRRERKTAEDELMKHRERLEDLVKERTAELAIANQWLQNDIAERKRAEREILDHQERLRSLASASSLAEERERKRISTELHDRIGQPLLATKMMLGSLRESISRPQLAGSLDEIEKLISRTIEDVRSLSFELSLPILYMFGFEAAVEWLIEQSRKRYATAFAFEKDDEPKPLDDDLGVFLFQAVRELLGNIGEHAEAQQAKVAIGRGDGTIIVDVEDDGIGFDVSRIDSRRGPEAGFGLFSIRERLLHFGGSFDVISDPERGTRVVLEAPLKAHSEAVIKESAPA